AAEAPELEPVVPGSGELTGAGLDHVAASGQKSAEEAHRRDSHATEDARARLPTQGAPATLRVQELRTGAQSQRSYVRRAVVPWRLPVGVSGDLDRVAADADQILPEVLDVGRAALGNRLELLRHPEPTRAAPEQPRRAVALQDVVEAAAHAQELALEHDRLPDAQGRHVARGAGEVAHRDAALPPEQPAGDEGLDAREQDVVHALDHRTVGQRRDLVLGLDERRGARAAAWSLPALHHRRVADPTADQAV